jgi:ADP-heptose:LPS heptosyltransferase
MESILARLPTGSRVAVIRLRSLGDCVLTTPALHLLKRHRPDLHVSVVVEERFRSVFEGNPDIESLLPAEPGAVRRSRPALCLNLHGGTRSAWMTALSGARSRAGFSHFSLGFVYNVGIPRAQVVLGEERTVHTAEHLASAMFHLGVPRTEVPRARLFASPAASAGRVAVIHAVAATPEKTWPAARFIEVARHLRSNGLEPVFVGGPGDDLSPFSEFRTMAGAPLDDVKALLAGAAVFAGNDSGPAHMAAAFGVPVVVLFGPSDPVVWAPWKTAGQVLTGANGIASIETRDVIQALDRLKVHA